VPFVLPKDVWTVFTLMSALKGGARPREGHRANSDLQTKRTALIAQGSGPSDYGAQCGKQ
jgi:hypothetical protein